MDAIGYFSYAIPLLGELSDIIWAPVSAIIFFFTFRSRKGVVLGGLFNFMEELLPGLDFIPSFTIMWGWQRLKRANYTSTNPLQTGNQRL